MVLIQYTDELPSSLVLEGDLSEEEEKEIEDFFLHIKVLLAHAPALWKMFSLLIKKEGTFVPYSTLSRFSHGSSDKVLEMNTRLSMRRLVKKMQGLPFDFKRRSRTPLTPGGYTLTYNREKDVYKC